jgi:hypothetical protein
VRAVKIDCWNKNGTSFLLEEGDVATARETGKPSLVSRLRKSFKWPFVLLLVVGYLLTIRFLNSRKLELLTPFVAIVIATVVYVSVARSQNLVVLIEMFPFLGKLIERDKQVRQNSDDAERIRLALQHFGLRKLPPDYFEALAKSVPATEKNAVEYYARTVAEKIDPQAPGTYEQIILLLYEAFTGASRPDRWTTHKSVISEKLAEILLESGKLNSGVTEFPLEAKELLRLLLRLDNFSERAVKDQLAILAYVRKYTTEYIQFLSDHHVAPPGTTVHASEILEVVAKESLSLTTGDLDSTSFASLAASGASLFGKALDEQKRLLLDSFVLVSIALFVIKREPGKSEWRSVACQRAANEKESPRIVLAWLEFEKEAEEHSQTDLPTKKPPKRLETATADFGTLKHLILNWRSKDEELRKLPTNGYELEIGRIKHEMTNGMWPQGLLPHIRGTFKQAGAESSVRVVLDERPWLQQALRRAFERVSTDTIKRFARARTVSPYFITFSSGSWHVRPLLEQLEDKYRFKQYTDNVRIGVIPNKWTFEKFYKEFDKDFGKLLREELKERANESANDLELIVQQFDISPGNYHGFVMPDITQEKAVQRLKQIFSDILGPKELLGMIEYQGNIPLTSILLESPISDLIACLQDISQEEKDVIEKRSSRLQSVMKSIYLPSLKDSSIRGLGQYFIQSSQWAKDSLVERVGKGLHDALKGEVQSLDEPRCGEIAKNYLETIAAIVSIDSAPIPSSRP